MIEYSGLNASKSEALRSVVRLAPEMTYTETIDGPWRPSAGSPLGARLCWQVTEARLRGPRIDASLVMPGADWIRLGADGIRRQDLRATLCTDDGALLMFGYDLGIIRESEAFISALSSGAATSFEDGIQVIGIEPGQSAMRHWRALSAALVPQHAES